MQPLLQPAQSPRNCRSTKVRGTRSSRSRSRSFVDHPELKPVIEQLVKTPEALDGSSPGPRRRAAGDRSDHALLAQSRRRPVDRRAGAGGDDARGVQRGASAQVAQGRAGVQREPSRREVRARAQRWSPPRRQRLPIRRRVARAGQRCREEESAGRPKMAMPAPRMRPHLPRRSTTKSVVGDPFQILFLVDERTLVFLGETMAAATRALSLIAQLLSGIRTARWRKRSRPPASIHSRPASIWRR